MKKETISCLLSALAITAMLTGCDATGKLSGKADSRDEVLENDSSKEMEINSMSTPDKMFEGINVLQSNKAVTDNNPVMVQRFGADPYALVYNGRVYLYMTGDKVSYNPDKTVKENTYGNIDTICVISSDDLVNWTDHGTVYAAGRNGAASWGANSWAPAAAYKKIDGKDKFFLYFANNGNGIAVLEADSPVGPFTDPINGPLISRETPTCAEVTWLFDPAVLMDDDGENYIYFGGGVPSPDKASNPGTARVAKLGKDMISIEGDPKPIENVSYLFEDSGINKIGDTYFYSYCTNFNVTDEAVKEHGFHMGEIMTMKSKNPMGPFEECNPVLQNPEHFFGLGGNNHHCMFELDGQWYITYHARILEEKMGINGGYRSTNVDKLVINDKNEPAASVGTRTGVDQLKAFDPYVETKAVTMSNAAGITTKQFGEDAVKYGSGDMIVSGITDGAWICVSGVDFAAEGADKITIKALGSGKGAVKIALDSPSGTVAGYVGVSELGKDLKEISAALDSKITGKHNLYFVFAGKDYELYSWKFEK
ncbi:glycoside hydrolase family 43 protein [Butyrivibrio sp. NC3005]|uniref:glycoside hydrolase family 43 protein n=1 Tax=Butyrivibrio sp. NC3005 TaxID=1280685 RepID=UPI00041E0865|nr:glycoside hydrolase family 43 protein [Butyrivibrio sp. NC3005]